MTPEMTPEERFERIERTLEFVANQQARFFSDLEELRGATLRNSEQIEKNSEQIRELMELAFVFQGRFDHTAELMERQSERLERLELALVHTGERFDRHIEESRRDRELLRSLMERPGGFPP
jgi:hypothetical protein